MTSSLEDFEIRWAVGYQAEPSQMLEDLRMLYEEFKKTNAELTTMNDVVKHLEDVQILYEELNRKSAELTTMNDVVKQLSIPSKSSKELEHFFANCKSGLEHSEVVQIKEIEKIRKKSEE